MPLITERLHVVVCGNCDQEFWAGRKDTRFCSDACQMADWYRRQVEKRSEQQQ